MPQNRVTCGLFCEDYCRTSVQRSGTLPPATNGCTLVGQGPFGFTPACNRHDTCFGTCGSTQQSCDIHFLIDMVLICMSRYDNNSFWQDRCLDAATSYYGVVSSTDAWFEDAQDGACTWKPCGNCGPRMMPWDDQPYPWQNAHPELEPAKPWWPF